MLWTFTDQVAAIQPGDRLTVCTNCSGVLTWRVDGGAAVEAALTPAGGVMVTVRPS